MAIRIHTKTSHSAPDKLTDRLKSHSEEIKQLLRRNTQNAIESGVCGLPWFIATNSAGEKDVFWGFDHLGQVVTFLGLGWLPSPHM